MPRSDVSVPGLESQHSWINPFHLEDLLVFDMATLRRLLDGCLREMSPKQLAWSVHTASPALLARVSACLPQEFQATFFEEWRRPVPQYKLERAQQQLLDAFFWELTYWKTPHLYDELTIGEQLHPGIFQRLEPLLRGKVVLDAGAGSGRATWEALHHGADKVYAVEPSLGLVRLLQEKMRVRSIDGRRIHPLQGDFAHLPLADLSVDVALACSAFTAESGQGGEVGLAELKRVTRPGGSIVLIWPRPEDVSWLQARGFQYVALPGAEEMCVHFPSLASARRCVRHFYADKRSALAYLLRQHPSAAIPCSVLGFNPPCDYCLLHT